MKRFSACSSRFFSGAGSRNSGLSKSKEREGGIPSVFGLRLEYEFYSYDPCRGIKIGPNEIL